MPSSFSQNKLFQIYKNLPGPLVEALASAEIADDITEICENNGVKNAQEVEATYRLCGDVLLGVLPINDFGDALQKEIKIEGEKLSVLTRELNRHIFYPLKPELDQLYGLRPKELYDVPEETDAEEGPLESIPPSRQEPALESEEEIDPNDPYREAF